MEKVKLTEMAEDFEYFCRLLGIEESSLSGPLALLLISAGGLILGLHSTPGNTGVSGMAPGMQLEMPYEGGFPLLPRSCRKCTIYVEKLPFCSDPAARDAEEEAWVTCLCSQESSTPLYQGILRIMAEGITRGAYAEENTFDGKKKGRFSGNANSEKLLPDPGESRQAAAQKAGKTVGRKKRKILTADQILEALRENNFHRGMTAEALGVSRTTLYRRMMALEIYDPENLSSVRNSI